LRPDQADPACGAALAWPAVNRRPVPVVQQRNQFVQRLVEAANEAGANA